MQNIKLKVNELAIMNVLVDVENHTIKIPNGLDEVDAELTNVIQA